MDMVIRGLTEDDITEVIELWQEVGDYHDYLDTPQVLLDKARMEKDLFLVAEIQGQVIGTLWATGKTCTIKRERGRRHPCFYLHHRTRLYPPPWAGSPRCH